MKRDYSTGTKTTPIFFVGTEVEHTPAYGQKTLFVVDKQDPNEIIEYARGYNCTHVYIGANHSFVGDDRHHYSLMIKKIVYDILYASASKMNSSHIMKSKLKEIIKRGHITTQNFAS